MGSERCSGCRCSGLRRSQPLALCSCVQSGLELSSRVEALSSEKEALNHEARQREAQLEEAQSRVSATEEALRQEQQRNRQERDELQGRLDDKVGSGSL